MSSGRTLALLHLHYWFRFFFLRWIPHVYWLFLLLKLSNLLFGNHCSHSITATQDPVVQVWWEGSWRTVQFELGKKKSTHYLFCYGLSHSVEHKGVFLSPVPSVTKAFSNVKSWAEPVGISKRRKLRDLIDGRRWGLSDFTSSLVFPFSFPHCAICLTTFTVSWNQLEQRSRSWGLQILPRFQFMKESRTVCRCLLIKCV